MRIASCVLIGLFVLVGWAVAPARAQNPYFVAYDHHLEEPGELEIALKSTAGSPKGGGDFLGSWTEFEYGARAWWTTELYLDWQTTSGQGSLFTGWRWENRIRPLMRNHFINPVLYVEYEDLNAGDKIIKEIVGFESGRNVPPNSEARHVRDRRLETKLILSSDFKGWNATGNFIAEKPLRGGAWELGYAIGVSRPLKLAASPNKCRFCPENFVAGLEFYGGLGDVDHLTLSGTSHYLGTALGWNLPNDMSLSVEPSWGLTSNSQRALLRFGVSYEISGFGQKVRTLLAKTGI